MCRYGGDSEQRPYKASQLFFCLDADTHQPVCFTLGSSSISASQATPPLLRLANRILQPAAGQTLVVADSEHFTAQIVDSCKTETAFDLLVPMDNTRSRLKQMRAIPPETFVRRWAGFATAKLPYQMKRTGTGPHWLYVQRSGETEQDAQFCGFLCTRDRQEVDGLTADYPKRWHVEEFFNAHQALGWERAGTMNLNIRYGQMTTALIAQAVIHQFRERIGKPWNEWDAAHLARSVFRGIDGDIRICNDTVRVTLYNAPNPDSLREHSSPARRRYLQTIVAESGDVDITKYNVLVSIGRGIQEQENVAIAQDLADAMGGAVSCSRPVVDAKWLEKSRQVGTSGKTVKPKVYLALGISGAVQHLAGMKTSGTIIAVNTDPEASIFNVAHYGAVVDLFDVVEELEKLF